MKTRMCRLEFGINCLADIRFLYYAWDRLWSLEGEVPLVYVTIEDRLPGEQVSLNFQAGTEVLDRFLSILEQDGLRFSCDEIATRPLDHVPGREGPGRVNGHRRQ